MEQGHRPRRAPGTPPRSVTAALKKPQSIAGKRTAKVDPPADPNPTADTAAETRAQLERVLKSGTFEQADRLKRFLTFIVAEAAAGRRHELKEYVIGVQVFGSEDAFDPRTDPIVRVQARRLRAKLVRYYRDEGRRDSL